MEEGLYFILYMRSALLIRSHNDGREWIAAAFYKCVHLGTAYSGSRARMALPFLKWGRGSLMTLGMGIKCFNSSGYKKWRERTKSICPKHFGNMLSFVSRTELVAFGREATATSPSFAARREFHLPPVFTKDICHWTFCKGFRPKAACKTRKVEAAWETAHFRQQSEGPSIQIFLFNFVTSLRITNVSLWGFKWPFLCWCRATNRSLCAVM